VVIIRIYFKVLNWAMPKAAVKLFTLYQQVELKNRKARLTTLPRLIFPIAPAGMRLFWFGQEKPGWETMTGFGRVFRVGLVTAGLSRFPVSC
jgi:hypothetical protein